MESNNAIPTNMEARDEPSFVPGDGFKLCHGMWAKPSSFVRHSGGEELSGASTGKVEVG